MLRTDAQSAREQHGDASENHLTQIVTWVSLGIGIVLVIVVGTLLLVRTRRTKSLAYVPAPHAPVPPLAYPPHQGWPGALVAAPPHHPAGATDGSGHPYAPTVQIRAAHPAEDPPSEPVPATAQHLSRQAPSGRRQSRRTRPSRTAPIRRHARSADASPQV